MATAATNLMTAEEFFDFANRLENRDRRFELEEGEIVEMPSPGERHGAVYAMLCWFFVNYARVAKRGRAFLFLDKGVSIVWLADPESRSISVWWPGHSPLVFDDSQEIANLPGLPDLRCKVAEIFE